MLGRWIAARRDLDERPARQRIGGSPLRAEDLGHALDELALLRRRAVGRFRQEPIDAPDRDRRQQPIAVATDEELGVGDCPRARARPSSCARLAPRPAAACRSSSAALAWPSARFLRRGALRRLGGLRHRHGLRRARLGDRLRAAPSASRTGRGSAPARTRSTARCRRGTSPGPPGAPRTDRPLSDSCRRSGERACRGRRAHRSRASACPKV